MISDWGDHFHSGNFSQTELPPPISALSDRGVFPRLGFGEYFRSWIFFHSWDFQQTGLPPPISALSDRGSVSTAGMFFTVAIFRRRNVLPRSRGSQIGGGFSWLGFCADGTSSPDIGALRSGECLHSGNFPQTELPDGGSVCTVECPRQQFAVAFTSNLLSFWRNLLSFSEADCKFDFSVELQICQISSDHRHLL